MSNRRTKAYRTYIHIMDLWYLIMDNYGYQLVKLYERDKDSIISSVTNFRVSKYPKDLNQAISIIFWNDTVEKELVLTLKEYVDLVKQETERIANILQEKGVE